MNISVFGLGYVGSVTSACLARDGHQVYGIDTDGKKSDMISKGEAPVIELGLSELLGPNVESGRLQILDSVEDVIDKTSLSFICVGTPSLKTGEQDNLNVVRVCQAIGEAVGKKDDHHHVIAIRSTILPGTTEKCGKVLEETAGNGLVSLAVNPEFLREGTAIRDYDSPPYTIIGTHSKRAEKALKDLYAGLLSPIIVTTPTEAEIVKMASNAWHAAKITFANEIGRYAKAHGVDGREVMRTLMGDTKLNISRAYMRPGFAYGGSCLPKDVRAITHNATEIGVQLPMLSSLEESNETQIEIAIGEILSIGKKKVGILGLAFKPGTDDLRESPSVYLVQRLLQEGIDLLIFDEPVRHAQLIGANRTFLEKLLPDYEEKIVTDAQDIIDFADILVITQGAHEFRAIAQNVGQESHVIDLVGTLGLSPDQGKYEGIAW